MPEKATPRQSWLVTRCQRSLYIPKDIIRVVKHVVEDVRMMDRVAQLEA